MQHTVPIYSIAKSYTAAAVLLTFNPQLHIGDRLVWLPAHLKSLSFEDLLSHRSGLNDYFVWPDYRAAVENAAEPWDAMDIIARAEVQNPGGFNYSNIGYLLLRLALEDFHQKPFYNVLDNLIFSPLGIQASPFDSLDDWEQCNHPAITEKLRNYHPGWVYTGTFAATPDEAARGIALIMRNELGSAVPEAMSKTHLVGAPQNHPMSPEAGYGLGLMTRGLPPVIVGHGGQGPGFNHFAAVSSDGSRWCGDTSAQEGEDHDLIRRCVAAVTNDDLTVSQ
ncbi:hypothetical protein CQ010_15975 [Arthrobacter sp. MYb211]|uniref:serine hydrolase domain-containing protein n=1 Tax=unclassified Arthrobacter TaxID=235627 RepID=UPI000CFBEB49|nr:MULTISPECIES: serine hydrolase domain-containing protein [unclassified Arthrobacter]PQZ98278.1 hypothetical protein CQ017_11740 [Arthrobacter sp. MYb224]PRA09928.1 hypothetical protein CQ015_15960 [Arthrobacter sp. MYb221]PRC05009.1 hypothetical protein CQ010_15975 [Arthrobacter sp. MYb211]